MLCFKLLGDEAQSSFARSWGVSYGVGAAAEWKARGFPCPSRTPGWLTRVVTRQEVAIEAVKAAVILAILERLCLTRPSGWMEVQ
jgi:hypothetical protein